ncbi:MAG TPA: hypothetical protein G4N93_03810 [Dehalococcoidia bacterium]|nr:hypothetical protein [Dehalococcoidia bacterium]
MTKPSWLPDALKYSDFNGDWDKFIVAVYEIFDHDFKQSSPKYQGYPITYDSRIEDGKEAVFWHIIQTIDIKSRGKVPDLRRCERIPWPRPMIEHPTDSAVSIWKNERPRKKGARQTRVLIWLEDLDYIVVLAEMQRVMILVTAYCTDIKWQREKLRKERERYLEMQKPP